jgi:hypothetical protein
VDEYEELALPSFKCPITHAVMRHPVVATDGNSYERKAIVRWLATNTSEDRSCDG